MDKFLLGLVVGIVMMGTFASYEHDGLLLRAAEAMTKCERNLPRNQECYAVIIAKPEGVE